MWQEITNYLLDKDLINQSILDAITPPSNDALIINTLLDNGIKSVDIVSAITVVSNFPKTSTIIANNDYCIENDILYIQNPLNDQEITKYVIKLNTGDIWFKKIGIAPVGQHIVNSANASEIKHTLDDIISFAVDNNATDIHISPRNTETAYFRFRIQGDLISGAKNDIALDDYQILANQLLILSGEDPGVFTHCVDGKFKLENNPNITIRIEMIPTDFTFSDGFKVPRFALRVQQSNSNKIYAIKDLNLSQYIIEQLQMICSKNQGLIYVTGPTGSSKTTLIYALIKFIQANNTNLSISTLEEPIEINVPGVDQTEINDDAKMSFANGIKAFMRLDSDVLLIGETRDKLTAQHTISLANTGHLTLSTLHTNTAIASINRLDDLGVNLAKISDTLTAIIAVRLVRKVCTKCSTVVNITNDLLTAINKYFNTKKNIIKLANKNGCKNCIVGYDGRTTVCELFVLDKDARQIIRDCYSEQKLIDYFLATKQKQGFFWADGFRLLLDSITTLDELIAKLPDDVVNNNLILLNKNLGNKNKESNNTKENTKSKKTDVKDNKEVVKRGRGRPPKNTTQEHTKENTENKKTDVKDNKEVVKKGRGRPKKNTKEINKTKQEHTKSEEDDFTVDEINQFLKGEKNEK